MNTSPLPQLPDPQAELGLADLTNAADALLAHTSAPRAAADGRVRAAPDVRTIRYYQSIGLVDRPLRYDGRRAVYGRRHLLQAVVVKLLQGEGLSLAQIQTALQGAPTPKLEAAVREALEAGPSGETSGPTPPVSPSPPVVPTPRNRIDVASGSDVPTRPPRNRAGRNRPMYPDATAGGSRLWSGTPRPQDEAEGGSESEQDLRSERDPESERDLGNEPVQRSSKSVESADSAATTSPPRDLLAYEIAPGIDLTIDPARAALDPPAARRLAVALARFLERSSTNDPDPQDGHDAGRRLS